MKKQKIKILIIEDEFAIKNILAHALEREGFEVTAVLDGQSGIEAMRETYFDVLLLDLVMPRMTGFDVLDTMVEEDLSVGKIFVTTNLSQEEVSHQLNGKSVDAIYVKADHDLMEMVDIIKQQIKKMGLGAAE